MLQNYNTKINILTALAPMCPTGPLHMQRQVALVAERFSTYATGYAKCSAYIITHFNRPASRVLRGAVSAFVPIVGLEVGGVIKITPGIIVRPDMAITGQMARGGNVRMQLQKFM